MQWSFAKYVGCGNDFILFDDRTGTFPHTDKNVIKQLCHRQCGIGADGILLLQLSSRADCRMRIFNADGSEAEMCGNGLRCFAKWIHSIGFHAKKYQIEVMDHIMEVQLKDGDDIQIQMGNLKDIKWNLELPYKDKTLTVDFLNTGVPHAVVFVDDVESVAFSELGPFLRYHPLWGKHGSNVNIVDRCEENQFRLRTFERGVEAETLACGTGATACAIAAAYRFKLNSPLQMKTRLNETLTIEFKSDSDTFSNISLTGSASQSFKGTVEIKKEAFLCVQN